MVVIDARSTEVDALMLEPIPGAINVPHNHVGQAVAYDRDVLVVIYCDGIGCNAPTKGVLT